MKRRIKAIKLHYTALLKENAADVIKDRLLYLEELIDKKHELFAQQQALEEEITAWKHELEGLKGLYDVVYEEEEDETKEAKAGEKAGEAPMIVESNGTIHG